MRGRGIPAPWVAVRVELVGGPPVAAVINCSNDGFTSAAPAGRISAITLRWYEAPEQYALPGH
jgi:hypothetical protein